MNPEFNINQNSDNKTAYGRTYEQHSGQVNEVSLSDKYGNYVKIFGLILLLLAGWIFIINMSDKSVSEEIDAQVRSTLESFNSNVMSAQEGKSSSIVQAIAASEYVTSKFSREIDSDTPEIVSCTNKMSQKMTIVEVKSAGDNKVDAIVNSGSKDFSVGLVNNSGWKINTADCS